MAEPRWIELSGDELLDREALGLAAATVKTVVSNSYPISFTHILNPFRAKVDSGHWIASRVTWQTLRIAHARARAHGLDVDCCAVILPGDESAVEEPVGRIAYLNRTIQDIKRLKPPRLFPLIEDVLTAGASGSLGSHVIFSNMDISVKPDFYLALADLVTGKLGTDVPFTVHRSNIDPSLALGSLEQMYEASGPLGIGYDCFVIPKNLVQDLDLGTCCIGAPHFDYLLFMALDARSGHRAKSMTQERLTFHLGNDIAWVAMIDYVEHNLSESLEAIARMRKRYDIVPHSAFERMDGRHFQRNALLSSRILRKIRRIPSLSWLLLRIRRAMGRQF